MTRALILALCVVAYPAMAQEQHAAGHVFYKSWSSGKTGDCCDNRHCGQIRDDDVREIGGKLFVYVHGKGALAGKNQWCEVTPKHYLTKGNAPNWQFAHACVDGNHGPTPCDQFLCFQPKPLF